MPPTSPSSSARSCLVGGCDAGGGRLVVGSRSLWVLALLVQATLVLYCALFGAGIHVPNPVNWVCGAIFGAYLPVAMTSWFAVHVDLRAPSVIWNVVLAGVFASFVIWVFSGLEAVKLCVCMGVLMFVGTFVLARKLRPMQGDADEAAALPALSADAFRYPASATFLFSFSFITAIAFAGIGGDSASYASGDFFAPMLLLCAVVLLANAAVLPLTTIAVPAIIVAVIAASYFHLEPTLSFDLAALGMFLFLAYAVVLLCASAQGGVGGALLRPLRASWWLLPPDALSVVCAWRSASRSPSNSRRTSWCSCLFWLPMPP